MQFFFFAAATILVIPTILINANGGHLSADQVDVLRVSRLSIANIDLVSPSSNVTTNPWGSGTSTYDSRQLSAVIMANASGSLGS